MLLTCIKIFAVRIFDVTLGTIRTMYLVKGKTYIPSIIAFFEVIAWYFIAREALTYDGNSIIIGMCYAGGYATGTYLGIIINKRFSH